MRFLSTRTMQMRELWTSTMAEDCDKHKNNANEVAKHKNNANEGAKHKNNDRRR